MKREIKKCKSCKKLKTIHALGYCQGCYNYFKTGGKIHPIPEYGKIETDDNGKLICHICGKSYIKLGGHIKESHEMTRKMYSTKFGLDIGKGLCENTHKKYLHELVKNNYNKVVKDNLINKGKSTRFKIGNEGRTRDKVSEQTRKVLVERWKEIKK